MRLAISGSHSTGKSTLIAAFSAQRPHYSCEPEAYEVLADDIALVSSEGPDLDGLTALLEYSVLVLASYEPGASVIFERSPADYLAYAAASRAISPAECAAFIRAQVPSVRDAVRRLEAIALLPVSDDGPITSRPGESEGFRERVDKELRRTLVEDVHELFGDRGAPAVLELSPCPLERLEELVRLTAPM